MQKRICLSLVLTLCTASGCDLGLGGGGGGRQVGPSMEVDPPGPDNAPTSLSVLSYNVAGLPQRLSNVQPARNIPMISPLLNGFDVVLVQEDFAYHAELIRDAEHPYASDPLAAQNSLGDGLNMLSTVPFSDFIRETWDDCYGTLQNGADCLTPKGFSMARLVLSEGVLLDVYDLHADAGTASPDIKARMGQFRQLARAIGELSADNAVIVAGDFNEAYTREGGRLLVELFDAAGLRDAWLELTYGGVLPRNAQIRAGCGTDPDDPNCDRIDKIAYRSSEALTLTPVTYAVEGATFQDAQGNQLSDHRPVSVLFELDYPSVD